MTLAELLGSVEPWLKNTGLVVSVLE